MEWAELSDDLRVAEFDWTGWDFYPSQWNAGALLISWRDSQSAPLVAFAAPGVSLCGEAGLQTASWRRATWRSADGFFERSEPSSFEVLDLELVCAETPPDFADWAAEATAAHVERLRAFYADRPGDREAAESAERLDRELETSLPGVRERLESHAEIPWGKPRSAERLCRKESVRLAVRRRLTVRQITDALTQLLIAGLVYGFYRFVRESWVPEGVHVEISEVLLLPLGQFFLWVYGFAHLLLPIAFLGWLYVRERRRSFVFARNTLVIAALLSIAGYLAHAPQPIYGAGASESIPASALATMPGLHLTVALSLAYLGFELTRRGLAKIAWIAYPVFVLLVFLQSDVRHLGATVAFSLAVVAVSVLIAGRLLPRIPLPPLRRLTRRDGDHVGRDRVSQGLGGGDPAF